MLRFASQLRRPAILSQVMLESLGGRPCRWPPKDGGEHDNGDANQAYWRLASRYSFPSRKMAHVSRTGPQANPPIIDIWPGIGNPSPNCVQPSLNFALASQNPSKNSINTPCSNRN